jgi:hypothetical protein
MSPELRDAIESARSRGAPFKGYCPVDGTPTRWYSFETIQHLFLAVIRELPEEMSVREIREQLE